MLVDLPDVFTMIAQTFTSRSRIIFISVVFLLLTQLNIYGHYQDNYKQWDTISIRFIIEIYYPFGSIVPLLFK